MPNQATEKKLLTDACKLATQLQNVLGELDTAYPDMYADAYSLSQDLADELEEIQL